MGMRLSINSKVDVLGGGSELRYRGACRVFFGIIYWHYYKTVYTTVITAWYVYSHILIAISSTSGTERIGRVEGTWFQLQCYVLLPLLSQTLKYNGITVIKLLWYNVLSAKFRSKNFTKLMSLHYNQCKEFLRQQILIRYDFTYHSVNFGADL